MVATRSKTAPKQAKLEDFNAGAPKPSATKSSIKTAADSKSTTKSSSASAKATDQSKKRKQPPSPPPMESIPTSDPENDSRPRPRKVPKGSNPSDPIASGRRAAQTRQEDPKGAAPEARNGAKSNTRKANVTKAKKSTNGDESKQQTHFAQNGEGGEELKTEKPIMINRAPVLTLWGACVAAFLHDDLSWEACLSVGSAIATLCAVSKGKAIGMVETKDEDEDKAAQKENKKKAAAAQGAKSVKVLNFTLPIKNNAAMLSGSPKNQNEDALISKFGGQDQYDAAKQAMQKALESWQNDKDELDGKAFHMYEKFRPSVPQGGQGWGRKGELNLREIENVVKR